MLSSVLINHTLNLLFLHRDKARWANSTPHYSSSISSDWLSLCLQAVVLILDKNLVKWYLCNYNSSSSSMWLTAACRAGLVDTLVTWISPELLAKQVGWNVRKAATSINKSKSHAGDAIPHVLVSASWFSLSLSRFYLVPSAPTSQLITFKVISLGRTKATGHGNRSHQWGRQMKELQLAQNCNDMLLKRQVAISSR